MIIIITKEMHLLILRIFIAISGLSAITKLYTCKKACVIQILAFVFCDLLAHAQSEQVVDV